MVSGVGFKNTADEERSGGPRKKTVSRGLLVAAGFLVIVIVIWGGLKMQSSSLDAKLEATKASVISVNKKISTALSEEASDSALRAYTMEEELYIQYESNFILDTIEDIMILKDSDGRGNRVVLKSFQHNAGANTKRTFADGDATTTGAGSVTITADADTFDVMAQQIEAFKNAGYIDEQLKASLIANGENSDKANELAKVYYFPNVKVGTTDRDDLGRIVFTLTMDVAKYDKSPYESGSGKTNTMMNVSQQQGTIKVNDNNGTQVIVGDDDASVKSDNTEVVANDDGANVQTENADVQATQ